MFRRLPIILFLVLIFGLLIAPVAAQDEPFATNTPVVEVTPIPAPEQPPVGDEQPDVVSRLLTLLSERGIEFAIVVAFLILALRTKNLIEPAEVQNLAERIFKIAKDATDVIPGTLDDTAREVVEEMIRKAIRDELSKSVPPPNNSAN